MNNAEVLIKFTADDKEAQSKMKGLGKTISSVVGSVAVSAAATATSAIVGLTTQAVNSFADYEQLVGGVETLFKDSASKVEEYADKAYKTAGISANKYMETVTSFSASLLQSTSGDTEKAADIANQAIIDMSDNANKMGTSMEAIQNAYQGFAKQNYTMLDNLKLGYGGTKSEMERLLADAEKISGVHYDISNLSDVYNAIHVIQGELGITGTTAEEAEKTISGSMNSMKSSFQNFLTSLATGENVDTALNELISSATTFGENLMPVIETVINTIIEMLPNLIQIVAEKLPQMVLNLLPKLIEGTVAVIEGLIEALPQIIEMIAEMLPTLLPVIIDAILSIIPMLIDHLPEFIEAGFKLIIGLVEGLLNAVPVLISKTVEIGWSLIKSVGEILNPGSLWEIGKQLLQGLWNGISNVKDWIISKVKGIGSSILGAIKGIFGIHSPSKEFAIIGEYNMLGLEKGMEDMQPEIQKDIDGMFDLSPTMMGSMNNTLSPTIQVINNIDMQQDPLGQMVNNIKTFSGGSKNDYNYGAGV